MKTRFSKKWIIGLVGIAPFALTGVCLAQGSDLDLAPGFDASAGESAQSTQVDPRDYAGDLGILQAKCGADSDIVEAIYHAETQTVDLSDFNGCSVTVRTESVMAFKPNGE